MSVSRSRPTPSIPSFTSIRGTAAFPGLHAGTFPARLAALATKSSASSEQRGDGRLWAIAFGLSLLFNGGLLAFGAIASFKTRQLHKDRPAPPPAVVETTLLIFPDVAAAAVAASTRPEPPPAAPAKPRFARTSEDQTAQPPDNAPMIGERNTRATSDRAPVAAAPPLPSQAGIAPKSPGDLETTESRYTDGSLASTQAAKPQQEPQPSLPAPPPSPIPDPALAATPAPAGVPETPGNDDLKSPPPPRPVLMQGPNPMDVPVPRNELERAEAQPRPAANPQPGKPAAPPRELPKPPAPKPADDPGFRGHQRKTAIVGSISRTGRSSLDVADSPLGRYQAQISRAVEQEWQRNCVRHRDFITPGFLTVRFFVEASGKVRTVQFVGQMETGEVQKGFTLNSIRNAGIPAMPATLKKDFAKEPLELIFNFYF